MHPRKLALLSRSANLYAETQEHLALAAAHKLELSEHSDLLGILMCQICNRISALRVSSTVL